VGGRNFFLAMGGSRSHLTAAVTCPYTWSSIEESPIAKCENFGMALFAGLVSLRGRRPLWIVFS
jgi:hypothetical protein